MESNSKITNERDGKDGSKKDWGNEPERGEPESIRLPSTFRRKCANPSAELTVGVKTRYEIYRDVSRVLANDQL